MTGPAPLGRELLLIADLSGYTGYLAHGELEEAPLIAGDLLDRIVGSLVPPFTLAGLEGDAAFLHVDPARLDGPGLLSAIGGCYDAFRRRLESLRLGSSCQCSACRTVPQLDLKFFVHLGVVLRQRIAGRDELAGRDVILVHRLMKDSAPAQAGSASYALLTDAVVEGLGLDPPAHGLEPVEQRYEHLGVVRGYVLDVRAGWERRLHADPAEGEWPVIAEAARAVDSPPSVVWEHLTAPALRQAWEGIESIEALAPGRAPGIGSLSRCVATHLTTIEEIVDWRPTRRLARRTELPDVGSAVVAYDLAPAGSGTQLSVRWHAPIAPAGLDPGAPARSLDRLAAATVSG